MALGGINPIPDAPKKGGGAFGSVLGGALGALGAVAAAPFTGGASLSYLPAAMGTGLTVGGIAGEAMDPSKMGGMAYNTIPTIPQKTSPLQYMMKMPEVQMATMENAKKLLAVKDIPEAGKYMEMIDSAKSALQKKLGGNTSVQFPYGG